VQGYDAGENLPLLAFPVLDVLMKLAWLAASLLVFGESFAPTAWAQNDAGVVAFANSGAPAAQATFLHGLAQLHNFEYGAALADFRAAEKIDPGFAMAYWGEAMTYNHPIWMQQDPAAARSALERLGSTAKARLAKAPTDREKDYLRAVDILYGEGDKKQRDLHYAEAMNALRQKYPDDVDAAAFYALALLGTAEGVRDERIYMRAAGIAIPLFYNNPHHPGAAHYLIHSCDDPVHAPLALPAAEAYSKIAPVAPHAQHMTSHIFLALGMWKDVIQANEAAMATANRGRVAAGRKPEYCGHANYWLEYGYLETGQIEQANRLLEGCRAEAAQAGAVARAQNVADPDNAILLSFLQMQARYVIDTANWNSEAAAWNTDVGTVPMAQFAKAEESGFSAAGRGDLAEARRELSMMEALLPKLAGVFDHAAMPSDDPMRRAPEIEYKQLDAIILSAEGKGDEAIARAQEAASDEKDLPYAFGPPDPVKPSYELLGELLLKQNRAREAEAAFRQALLRAPNRTQTLKDLELANAQAVAGSPPTP
jgi:tetratricopeptide (TPR) repeat protein